MPPLNYFRFYLEEESWQVNYSSGYRTCQNIIIAALTYITHLYNFLNFHDMRIFLENNEPKFLLKCTSFKNKNIYSFFDNSDAFEDVWKILFLMHHRTYYIMFEYSCFVIYWDLLSKNIWSFMNIIWVVKNSMKFLGYSLYEQTVLINCLCSIFC